MSDEPIDFQTAHDRRHGPSPEFTMRDDDGSKWFTFICSYRDDNGERWGFQLWARDIDDARRRLALIAMNGTVDGKLYSEIPA